jgi:hypothetical protein
MTNDDDTKSIVIIPIGTVNFTFVVQLFTVHLKTRRT